MRRKAFTLVEVMIVLTIIGLLVAIAVPQWITARQNARLRVIVGNLKEIEQAKQSWAMELGKAETEVPDSAELSPDYMKPWPDNSPVSGDYEPNAVIEDATFRGKSADQWLADPSDL